SACGALGVDPTIGEGGSCAGADAAEGIPESAGLRMGPDFRPGVGIEADDGLVVAALLLRKKVAIDDGHRGPAGSDGSAPQLFGRILIPMCIDGEVMDNGITVGATEAGPVARAQGQGREWLRGGLGGWPMLGDVTIFGSRAPAPMEVGGASAI